MRMIMTETGETTEVINLAESEVAAVRYSSEASAARPDEETTETARRPTTSLAIPIIL